MELFRDGLLLPLCLLLQHDEQPDLLIEMGDVLPGVIEEQKLRVELMLVLLLLLLPDSHRVLHALTCRVNILLELTSLSLNVLDLVV